MPADKKMNLVRFAHNLSSASRSCDWNNGLRLLDPTARREQWNDGILGPLALHLVEK